MYKVRNFLKEIKYAVQRACRGYDDAELYSISYSFIKRMNLILPVFKDKHSGCPYGLKEHEWNNILDEMIYEFRLADEDNFSKHFSEKYNIDLIKDEYDIKDYCNELDLHQQKALSLFIKYFNDLWD